MIKNLIKEKSFCGLDIGAQSVKAALVHIRDSGQPVLSGVYETRTTGYRDGSVTDLAELSECLNRALSGLSKKSKVKIDAAALGIGGELVVTRQSYAAIPLIDRGNKVITTQDIKKIRSQSKLLGIQMDEIVLHQFPLYYKIDDINISSNPLGLYGRKLEIDSLMILGKNTLIKNLVTAVNQAGCDISLLSFAGYAGSQAALSDQQRREGCILVDIGWSLSSVLMFQDGILKALFFVPVGGMQITKSIAASLHLTFDLAEDIKRSYGFAPGPHEQVDEDILIKREEEYAPIKKRAILEAIEPVCDRLVTSIIEIITNCEIADQMTHGIVMVGGGALLPGLPERLEAKTNFPVLVGHARCAARKMGHAPKFISSIGLAHMHARGSLENPAENGARGRGLAAVVQRVKELYQEYF